MTAYATQADFEGYVEGWVTDNVATLGRLLERASRDIDTVLGPIPILTAGAYAGWKLDPTQLADFERQALARATCAQAEHRFRNPSSFDSSSRRMKRVKGPDFEKEYADADAASTGFLSPQVRRELAPIAHLRITGGRAAA